MQKKKNHNVKFCTLGVCGGGVAGWGEQITLSPLKEDQEEGEGFSTWSFLWPVSPCHMGMDHGATYIHVALAQEICKKKYFQCIVVAMIDRYAAGR